MNSVKIIIENDKKRLFPKKISLLKKIKYIITRDQNYLRIKYLKYMRKCDCLEYNNSLIESIKKMYYQRKKNVLGLKFGYEIGSKNIKSGLCLLHNGPIVIHGKSIIGENCTLHGDNCIGNNGIDDECPIIGDNVDIGVGAKIIGNVKIANRVKIGASAVVVKDILEEGATVVGIPGRVIKNE